MNEASLYIHIPFCQSKCLYCDFPSFGGMDEQFALYHQRLKEEIIQCALSNGKRYTIKTIFLGGGTPSVFPPYFVAEILETIYAHFSVAEGAEITMECNPGTITKEKLGIYKGAGINRISLGLQASQNSMLKQLGRIHTWEQFLDTYHHITEAGFENINVDLMFALPNQTLHDLEQTLDLVVSLRPKHISAYSLIVEEGTPFHRMLDEKEFELPDDELDRQMYELIKHKLQMYQQYEISNFAMDGFACKHNVVYWTRKNYFGFGLAAHSFVEGARFFNTSSLEDYLAGVTTEEPPVPISGMDAYAEFLFLGLRMSDGISMHDFAEQFHVSLLDVYGKQIEKLVQNNLLVVEGDRMYLTSLGIDLSNRVFIEFME